MRLIKVVLMQLSILLLQFYYLWSLIFLLATGARPHTLLTMILFDIFTSGLGKAELRPSIIVRVFITGRNTLILKVNVDG